MDFMSNNNCSFATLYVHLLLIFMAATLHRRRPRRFLPLFNQIFFFFLFPIFWSGCSRQAFVIRCVLYVPIARFHCFLVCVILCSEWLHTVSFSSVASPSILLEWNLHLIVAVGFVHERYGNASCNAITHCY